MADARLAVQRHAAPWREARALVDAGRMLAPLLLPTLRPGPPRRRKLIVLPGFGADDRVTWPLRRYLRKLGHHAEGWGLGINRAGLEIRHTLADVPPGWIAEPVGDYRGEGAVPLLCLRMTARTRQRHAALGGAPLTLIGWSLGGFVAREVARELPDIVEQVITLGTPVQGGPKYTRAAPLYRRRGTDLDLIERSIIAREKNPIRCPVIAITSPSDGIVDHAATIDRYNPGVKHIELDVSHLGMCFNPTIWRIIADTLDAPA